VRSALELQPGHAPLAELSELMTYSPTDDRLVAALLAAADAFRRFRTATPT
jgi:hypothetical protein